MTQRLLEVIVTSIEDAVEAARGGAHRLEVVSQIEVGGLTPSLDLVRAIKTEVALPLRVMLRESVGFEVSNAAEFERLCNSAQAFNEIRVEGIVFGFLKDGALDSPVVSQILSRAPHVKVTFHHAFEAARDQARLILALKKFPQVDRILAHGGEGTWADKIERLLHYQEIASPEITILVGGGLDKSVILQLLESKSFSEFHVGSAARGGKQVISANVAELVRVMS